MRDYRDKLQILLTELHEAEGLTRYRIAKRSGISEQTLSNVMHKRRNLSIDALQALLSSVGYEIDFVRSQNLTASGPGPVEATEAVQPVDPFDASLQSEPRTVL